MKSNDLTMNRDDVRARLMQALSDNDKAAYDQAFNDMILCIENDINQRQAESVDEIREEADRKVLAQRGVRQLTSEEKKYYQKLAEAMRRIGERDGKGFFLRDAGNVEQSQAVVRF